jgi:hypothetical protein
MAWVKIQWQVIVNMVMNFWVLWKSGNFSATCLAVGFARTTLCSMESATDF